MTTAEEMYAAFTDGSRPFGEVLALAADFIGEPCPCRLCERNLYFGDTTCASCLLLLAHSARALRAIGPAFLMDLTKRRAPAGMSRASNELGWS